MAVVRSSQISPELRSLLSVSLAEYLLSIGITSYLLAGQAHQVCASSFYDLTASQLVAITCYWLSGKITKPGLAFRWYKSPEFYCASHEDISNSLFD